MSAETVTALMNTMEQAQRVIANLTDPKSVLDKDAGLQRVDAILTHALSQGSGQPPDNGAKVAGGDPEGFDCARVTIVIEPHGYEIDYQINQDGLHLDGGVCRDYAGRLTDGPTAIQRIVECVKNLEYPSGKAPRGAQPKYLEAAGWLRRRLQSGEMALARDVVAEAEGAGFSRYLIKQALGRLGVKAILHKSRRYYCLPKEGQGHA